VTLRHATILGLIGAALGVACLDLSAPKGPASISLIQLPAAFVVRGDFMRDSAGTPAPPVINQFNVTGQVIGGQAPQFFILDSTPAAAHFDPATSVLFGDHLGVVNFIGQVGALQTPSVAVPVTVQPTVIDQTTGAKDTIRVPITTDTTQVGSSLIPVRVAGAGDTTVQGVVVHYVITRTLASNDPLRPAVFIVNAQSKLTTTDTTNVNGVANRDTLVVVGRRLADITVATGQKVDSVIVQASASYKGTPLAGVPVTFVFHIVGTLTP